jgi:glycosyltransferase involved in cell wall biosynthesis
MVPTKGFPYLIRAAQLLKKRGRSFELRFIGDGPERRELRALVSALGLDGNVRFLGARPNAEVFHELIGAQVLVVPSARTPDGDMDGLPNVVLEAMSMARPVVGSRLSGIPEAVTHGETGLLAEPENPAELARQIEILFDDPGLARRLGRQARERVPATFDVNQNVHQVIRHIARAK